VSPRRAGGIASPPRPAGSGGTPGPLAAASRTPSPEVDLAPGNGHGRPDHVGHRLQRVLGACRVQRLGAERRETVDFGRALPGLGRLALGTREELGRDPARDQERAQDQPVERLGDGERVVRPHEEEVEAAEREDGEREAQRASAAGGGAEDEDQVREHDVRGSERCPHLDHRGGDDAQPAEPGGPPETLVATARLTPPIRGTRRDHAATPSRTGSPRRTRS
jgi:hypothetical protein